MNYAFNGRDLHKPTENRFFFLTGVSSDTGLLKAVLFVEIDDILDIIL